MSGNKIALFKLVARIVVGSGTATITKAIIENNVQPDTLPQKVSVALAGLVIGSMASEATRSHTDAQLDAFLKLVNSVNTDSEETPSSAE